MTRPLRQLLPTIAALAVVLGAALVVSQGGLRPTIDASTQLPGRTIEAPAAAAPAPMADAETPAPTPTPTPLPWSGSGTFTHAAAGAEPYGSPPYRTFSVAVEDGIGLDADELAAFVDETLSDPRSWIGDGITGFERVAEGGEWTLVVASPDTVDELCLPLDTAGVFSCGNNGWIALNLHRWLTATDEWPTDLTTYRRYLVNHETGHYLLGPAHPECPGRGEPAPIMMQQSKGLDGCTANGWPYPAGT